MSDLKVVRDGVLVTMKDMGDGTYSEVTTLGGSLAKDLGQIITGVNMAAGATLYSTLQTDLQWVRNVIIFVQSDQQYDLALVRYDTDGVSALYNATIAGTQDVVATPNWRAHVFSNLIIGKSCTFGIKNIAAVPNTYGNVRVQLLGL